MNVFQRLDYECNCHSIYSKYLRQCFSLFIFGIRVWYKLGRGRILPLKIISVCS